MSTTDQIHFPGETQEGIISIDGKFIIIKSNLSQTEIEVSKFVFVSVLVHSFDENCSRGVCLCIVDEDAEPPYSYHRKYIPCHFRGFKHVYTLLDQKYCFNNTVFSEAIQLANRHIPLVDIEEKLIWRKKQKDGFSILDTYPNDVLNGFEILAPNPVFIEWGTPEKLMRSRFANVISRKKPVRISHPVRIGNLVLHEPFTYQNHELHFSLTLPFQGDKCFFELENAIRGLFRMEPEEDPVITLWPHQISFGTTKGRLTFILHYDKNGEYRYGKKVEEYSWDFKDPDTTSFILRIEETDPVKLGLKRKQEEETRKAAEHTDAYRREFGY